MNLLRCLIASLKRGAGSTSVTLALKAHNVPSGQVCRPGRINDIQRIDDVVTVSTPEASTRGGFVAHAITVRTMEWNIKPRNTELQGDPASMIRCLRQDPTHRVVRVVDYVHMFYLNLPSP